MISTNLTGAWLGARLWANMALFLGSGEAAWITGGMFVVDGEEISC